MAMDTANNVISLNTNPGSIKNGTRIGDIFAPKTLNNPQAKKTSVDAYLSLVRVTDLGGQTVLDIFNVPQGAKDEDRVNQFKAWAYQKLIAAHGTPSNTDAVINIDRKELASLAKEYQSISTPSGATYKTAVADAPTPTKPQVIQGGEAVAKAEAELSAEEIKGFVAKLKINGQVDEKAVAAGLVALAFRTNDPYVNYYKEAKTLGAAVKAEQERATIPAQVAG